MLHKIDDAVSVLGGLTAHLQGDGVWGRSWGFRQAYYDYLAPTTCALGTECNAAALEASDLAPSALATFPPYDLRRPSDHVLPALYRLDAGLSYGRSWNGIDVQAQVSLVNVLDRPNVVEWRLHPRSDGTYGRFSRTLPGRHPVFSIRISY